MKTAIYSIMVLFCFVAQMTVFHFFSLLNISPDIIIALALHGGLRWGKMGGVQFGCVTGFIQDTLSYGSMGVNMLSKSLIGFIVGALREKYINDSVTARIMLVTGAVALDVFVYRVMTVAFSGYGLPPALGSVEISQAALNMAAAMVFIPVLTAVDERIDRAMGEKDSGLTISSWK